MGQGALSHAPKSSDKPVQGWQESITTAYNEASKLKRQAAQLNGHQVSQTMRAKQHPLIPPLPPAVTSGSQDDGTASKGALRDSLLQSAGTRLATTSNVVEVSIKCTDNAQARLGALQKQHGEIQAAIVELSADNANLVGGKLERSYPL